MSDRRLSHATSWRGYRLADIIVKLGQVPNLKLLLDAGDANSFPGGAGTKWLDTSGNGYDFFRGNTIAAAADDPTFNGTANNLSSGEYWSLDGADFFKYDLANEAWMTNIHKNNALFTLALMVWPGAHGVNNQTLMATGGTAAITQGFMWFLGGSGNCNLRVCSGSVISRDLFSALVAPAGGWHFVGVSVDEASNFGFNMMDNLVEAGAASYTSPGAGAAAIPLQIGKNNGSDFLEPGARLGMAMAWEGRALSYDELYAVFSACRGRYGI